MTTKTILIVIVILIAKFGLSQNYILPNEKLIYSFKTTNNKQLMLVCDTLNKYIAYRFGTIEKIEFEYPIEKTKDSWNKFEYSFFLRGGGNQNAGMDLNFIAFSNNDSKYIIYDMYHAEDNSQNIGLKVLNLKTNKTAVIKGIKSTQKGSLVDFRENKLVKKGEELYD